MHKVGLSDTLPLLTDYFDCQWALSLFLGSPLTLPLDTALHADTTNHFELAKTQIFSIPDMLQKFREKR